MQNANSENFCENLVCAYTIFTQLFDIRPIWVRLSCGGLAKINSNLHVSVSINLEEKNYKNILTFLISFNELLSIIFGHPVQVGVYVIIIAGIQLILHSSAAFRAY